MLSEFTTLQVFLYLLVFLRMGTAVMLLPGIGEATVNPRSRLLCALTLTLILMPVVKSYLPHTVPVEVPELLLLAAKEILVGLFMGSAARMVFSAVHIAGTIISYQTGLSTATLFDPSQGGQTSVVGNFLTALTLTLIFVGDFHYLYIYALTDSYTLFSPTAPWDAELVGEKAEYMGKLLSEVFLIAIQLAAPQIVVGMLLYLSAGVMSRLMPQLQVFFLIIPVQICVGIVVLMMTLSTGMLWYLEKFGELLVR